MFDPEEEQRRRVYIGSDVQGFPRVNLVATLSPGTAIKLPSNRIANRQLPSDVR